MSDTVQESARKGASEMHKHAHTNKPCVYMTERQKERESACECVCALKRVSANASRDGDLPKLTTTGFHLPIFQGSLLCLLYPAEPAVPVSLLRLCEFCLHLGLRRVVTDRVRRITLGGGGQLLCRKIVGKGYMDVTEFF